LVQGVDGANCKAASYAGWFFEGGISLGFMTFAGDVGFNEDGRPLSGYLQSLFGAKNGPGTLSGVYEVGAGVGAGWPLKGAWCYYTLIGEEKE